MQQAGKNKIPKRSKIAKLEFIGRVHGKGETSVSGAGAVKISSEKVAKLMTIVGTQEVAVKYPDFEYARANPSGCKTFLLVVLQLHPSQIKSY